MTRYEKYKNLALDEMVNIVYELVVMGADYITFNYCKEDCNAENGCQHEKECIKKWLMEEM